MNPALEVEMGGRMQQGVKTNMAPEHSTILSAGWKHVQVIITQTQSISGRKAAICRCQLTSESAQYTLWQWIQLAYTWTNQCTHTEPTCMINAEIESQFVCYHHSRQLPYLSPPPHPRELSLNNRMTNKICYRHSRQSPHLQLPSRDGDSTQGEQWLWIQIPQIWQERSGAGSFCEHCRHLLTFPCNEFVDPQLDAKLTVPQSPGTPNLQEFFKYPKSPDALASSNWLLSSVWSSSVREK